MSLSSLFERPLLIYDDKCYSCTKFAKVVSSMSRGWIRTAGHFYSGEARRTRDLVFPPNYDPTAMFWIIDRRGAHGARGGLVPVAVEVLRGLLVGGSCRDLEKNADTFALRCEYPRPGSRNNGRKQAATTTTGDNAESMSSYSSCYTPSGIARRLAGLLRKSKHFYFPKGR